MNDLATTHPALASEWHPTLNGDLTPDQVTRGSGKKVWWLCRNGHEWQATIANRARGRGCPFDSGHAVDVGRTDLATVNAVLASQWNAAKNNDLEPSQVAPQSNRKVWWLCPVCNFEWQAAISARSAGTGCPACCGHAAHAGVSDLATVNPDLAAQWHTAKNGNLAPTHVKAGSGRKVWWSCASGHEWEARIASRSAGSGCPVCVGRKPVSDADLHHAAWDRLASGAIDGIPGLQVGATRLMLRAIRPRSIAELADALALSPANMEKQRTDYLQLRIVNGPLAGLLANELTASVLASTRGVLLYTDQAYALVGALTDWDADQIDRLVRAYDQADLHTLAAIEPDFKAAASKRLPPETVRALTSHLFYGVYRSQPRQDWLTAAQDVFDAACRVVSAAQPSADRYTDGFLDLDRAQAQALRDSLDSWLNGQVG